MDGLSSLLSNLSPEDIESLKAAEASLMGDSGDEPAEDHHEKAASIPDLPINPQDLAMFSKLSGLLTSNNDKNDYRTNFLNALKPLLSEPRRKRADEAIRIIRMLDMLPVLKESGILPDFLSDIF